MKNTPDDGLLVLSQFWSSKTLLSSMPPPVSAELNGAGCLADGPLMAMLQSGILTDATDRQKDWWWGYKGTM
jgi:hypothetical protein